jgi:hypothetical protein
MENPIPEDLVEPPPGPELLREVEALLNRFIVLPPGGSLLTATWTIAAWMYDVFDLFPLLIITSPTKRCGKSNLLTLLREIVPRPCPTLNVSEAALFRTAEAERPTFFLTRPITGWVRGVPESGRRPSGNCFAAAIARTTRRSDDLKGGDGFKDVPFRVTAPRSSL